MEIEELREAVELARELKEILTGSPEVARFLQGDMQAFVPERCSRLLTVGQAAEALCVNKNRIGEYVREGKLDCIYTPPASRMKIPVESLNRFIKTYCSSKELQAI